MSDALTIALFSSPLRTFRRREIYGSGQANPAQSIAHGLSTLGAERTMDLRMSARLAHSTIAGTTTLSQRRDAMVPAQRYRRHWKQERKASFWHSIAEGPALLAKLPRQARFLTILGHHLDPDGNPAHYRGAFYFEFDATYPAQTLNDLRRCVQILNIEYDCPLEALHVAHPGGHGFHVTKSFIVFLVNTAHVKQVPGPKTDKADARRLPIKWYSLRKPD